MPQFWVEQKFIIDAEKASQIKLALNIPFIGQIIGIIMTIVGIVLMSMHRLKKLCQSHNNLKTEVVEKGAVIKHAEMNPLMH